MRSTVMPPRRNAAAQPVSPPRRSAGAQPVSSSRRNAAPPVSPPTAQRGVFRGMALALAITLVLLVWMIALPPRALLPLIGPTASLVAALRWSILPLLCLIVVIGLMARHRFFHAEDIDGSAVTATRGMTGGSWTVRIYQSILQNTLEQVVLAIPTYLIWSVTLPRDWQAALPVAAILFVIGRVLFWRGYAGGASARSLGFALTFYPTVILALIAAGAALGGLR